MFLLENVLAMLVDMDLIVQVSLDISALLLKKVTPAYFVFQSLIVLGMEHVQIKELAMIQQEPVFAIKDLKEQLVKVCN